MSAIAAALLWALADQAATGAMTADVAGTLWAVDRTLWRFATWGLTVPPIIVGLVLHRYSTLGQFGAVTSVMVAAGLLFPVTWAPSLYAFAAGWCSLARRSRGHCNRRGRVHHPELVE